MSQPASPAPPSPATGHSASRHAWLMLSGAFVSFSLGASMVHGYQYMRPHSGSNFFEFKEAFSSDFFHVLSFLVSEAL